MLSALKEVSGGEANTRYSMYFMVQDEQGRILPEGTLEPLTRTLSQIVGLTSTLAKREKENEVGRSAQQMLELLLDPTSHKRSADLRRISLEHFLNEILSLLMSNPSPTVKESARAFFALPEGLNLANIDK